MHLLTVLPAATLLVLWAAGETGLAQRVSCPSYCAARVIVVRNRTVFTETGAKADVLSKLTYDLQMMKPGVKKVRIQIGAVWVSVPQPLKLNIETAIKRFPTVIDIILDILTAKPSPKPSATTTSRRTTTLAPSVVTKSKNTKPTKRSTTAKSHKTKRTPAPKPTVSKKSTPKPNPSTPPKPKGSTPKPKPRTPPKPTDSKPKTKPTIKPPQGVFTKPQTKPTPKPTSKPPTSGLVPGRPGVVVPDAAKPIVVPPVSEGINSTVRAGLELILNFPNHFVAIYNILLKLGVKFPDLRKPVHNVSIGAHVIKLPRPIKVDFIITLRGQDFHLPKDVGKVAKFVSQHTAELSILITLLRPLGARFPLDKMGRIAGLEVVGQKENFPKALNVEVIVSTKKFSLPKDMSILLAFVKDKPAEFSKIEVLLRVFGVRLDKIPSKRAIRATYGKKPYDIKTVLNVPIFVRGRQYYIPTDLDSLFKDETGLHVGAILSALQRAKIPVNVDRKTGVVFGIVMDRVTIPFPVMLDLRFTFGGKKYIVPYDLPKIIAALEKKNMPSHIVSILYSRYGVVPVRNNDNAVIAFSFNGKNFLVKAQPTTVVIIAGLKFFLPKDAPKMIDAVMNKKFTALQMMQALQLAGYTFVPGPDGVLRTIQKGADRIDLNIELRLLVKLDGKVYRIPNDLQTLIKIVRSLPPVQIKGIKAQLEQYGVVFSRKGRKMVIMFNGIKYEVDLKPGEGPPSSAILVININTKSFSIPKDINAAVSFAVSNGPGAVRILIELLKAHGIKVNLSPKGSIISIVVDGKVYTVKAQGPADDSIQVKIRSKIFWIPREMLSLQTKFKDFNYAEVVIALIKMGATLDIDAENNFYGFRYKGRQMKFPKKFRIIVKVDKTGKKFRVPGQLGDLAKVLSKGKWDWKSVRPMLLAAGIQVADKSGPVKSFSFQGKKFTVG